MNRFNARHVPAGRILFADATREILPHDADVLDGVDRAVGAASEDARLAKFEIITGAGLLDLDIRTISPKASKGCKSS